MIKVIDNIHVVLNSISWVLMCQTTFWVFCVFHLILSKILSYKYHNFPTLKRSFKDTK